MAGASAGSAERAERDVAGPGPGGELAAELAGWLGADAVDVGAAVRTPRARADGKDEAYFAFRGIDGTRTFDERLLRLSGVIVWCETAAGDRRAAWWKNGSARIAVPEATTRGVLACLSA